MFFGFATPVLFIFPLLMFFVIARVASGFARGSSRRREFPPEYGFRPDLEGRRPQNLLRGRNSDESRVFRLALKLRGRVTVSDIVIETGLNLHDAEALVESMADNVHVRMEVDDQGRVVYEFPEIIRRLEEGT